MVHRALVLVCRAILSAFGVETVLRAEYLPDANRNGLSFTEFDGYISTTSAILGADTQRR